MSHDLGRVQPRRWQVRQTVTFWVKDGFLLMEVVSRSPDLDLLHSRTDTSSEVGTSHTGWNRRSKTWIDALTTELTTTRTG